MNTKLLNKIKRTITRRADQFDMRYWFMKLRKEINTVSHCGTTACLAGWAITLGDEKNKLGKKKAFSPLKGIRNNFRGSFGKSEESPDYIVLFQSEEVINKASELLGINRDQAMRLFFSQNWPEQFRYTNGVYFYNLSKKEQAEVACKRIDHFIATNGEE